MYCVCNFCVVTTQGLNRAFCQSKLPLQEPVTSLTETSLLNVRAAGACAASKATEDEVDDGIRE